LRQKPLVKGYNSSNFEQDLVAGDAWLAQAFNGNMTFALRDEPRLRYVVPKEGGTISVDCACIPLHAPHKDLAMEFINYFHRPEVASAFINDCGFNTPNLRAPARAVGLPRPGVARPLRVHARPGTRCCALRPLLD
jgi:spermidine/putrescine transport system substrate-binding protein